MPILIAVCVLVVVAVIAVGFYLDEPVLGFMGAAVVLVIAAFPLITYAYSHYNERTLTCTVTDKDRGGDHGSYRIYTDDCGQLANDDSMWRGKWNSADVWQQIQPGHAYRLTVVGWRVPFLSDFPDVLKVEAVR